MANAKKKAIVKKLVHKARSGKKPPLGSGERFAALKKKLAVKKGVSNPGALAAFIGRKKYGSTRFAKLSAKGRG